VWNRPQLDEEYDVFVSYSGREPGSSWVRGTLVPLLRAAGLQVCLDVDTFRLGAPIVTEIARAVERSRYTLAVLTPAYLVSGFTELEAVLAEHLGAERAEQRLLLVLREPCNPRLGLRARVWLDASGADTTLQLDRLVAFVAQ
jgi:TIR domain